VLGVLPFCLSLCGPGVVTVALLVHFVAVTLTVRVGLLHVGRASLRWIRRRRWGGDS
jgi:hypothetical protein